MKKPQKTKELFKRVAISVPDADLQRWHGARGDRNLSQFIRFAIDNFLKSTAKQANL